MFGRSSDEAVATATLKQLHSTDKDLLTFLLLSTVDVLARTAVRLLRASGNSNLAEHDIECYEVNLHERIQLVAVYQQSQLTLLF